MSEHWTRVDGMINGIGESMAAADTVKTELEGIIADPFHSAPAPEIVRAKEALTRGMEQLAEASHALDQLAGKINGKGHRADQAPLAPRSVDAVNEDGMTLTCMGPGCARMLVVPGGVKRRSEALALAETEFGQVWQYTSEGGVRCPEHYFTPGRP